MVIRFGSGLTVALTRADCGARATRATRAASGAAGVSLRVELLEPLVRAPQREVACAVDERYHDHARFFHAIHQALAEHEDLSNGWIVQFRDDAAPLGQRRQARGDIECCLEHVPSSRRGVVGDVLDDFVERALSRLGPDLRLYPLVSNGYRV